MTEDAILAHWDRVPLGASKGVARGQRWRAVRSVQAGGRSEKIVAHGSAGGYVSCNLYRLASGPRAFPCEMPHAEVAAVLADWTATGGTCSDGAEEDST